MKRRSAKLEKFIALASTEERSLGEATGLSQRRLQEEIDRLGELNAYRIDYEDRARNSGELGAAQWKDYRRFLARLDEAVRSQEQLIRSCEQTVNAHRQRWLAKRRRLESLERVLDRYRREEQAVEDRREQRVLDDLPTRRAPYTSEGDD